MPKSYKRNPRPYLLSTSLTLSRFDIRDYDGFDFKWNRDSRRKYGKDKIPSVAKTVLKQVIFPNALIVKAFC